MWDHFEVQECVQYVLLHNTLNADKCINFQSDLVPNLNRQASFQELLN
jgi:hypothetical protein